MSVAVDNHVETSCGSEAGVSAYLGLRMTAEEFLALPEDPIHYELVDGVVIVSPSPATRHQLILREITYQLTHYLDTRDFGLVIPDIDVLLGRGPRGGDLVYRPDLIFIRKERLACVTDRVRGVPDLVVEVVSPGSGRFDAETKKADYERCGVQEYWLINPQDETMVFYRLDAGRYVEVKPVSEQTWASQAVPGFTLDLARVRKLFKPW